MGASLPGYGSPSFVECAGERIDVGKWGAPLVTDWDGDGLEDLLVGQYHMGAIRVYLNENTLDDPIFLEWSYLYADGQILSVTWY